MPQRTHAACLRCRSSRSRGSRFDSGGLPSHPGGAYGAQPWRVLTQGDPSPPHEKQLSSAKQQPWRSRISSHVNWVQAGIVGRQKLADSWRVVPGGRGGAPRDILVSREVTWDSWQLEKVRAARGSA